MYELLSKNATTTQDVVRANQLSERDNHSPTASRSIPISQDEGVELGQGLSDSPGSFLDVPAASLHSSTTRLEERALWLG